MAKRISRRLRKLAPCRALAFMVSAGENGAVELTLYAGRRSLSRELDARDVRTLVELLNQTSLLSPDLRSTRWCGSSWHRPSSICGSDTNA